MIRKEPLLHVEWLAIDGEQECLPMKSSRIDQSILRVEQQMYFSFLQTNGLNDPIWRILRKDHLALDTVLSSLTDWCRMNISDCLLKHRRREKRRRLIHFITIINNLLTDSSSRVDHYLTLWLPMLMTILLYQFDVRKKRSCSSCEI